MHNLLLALMQIQLISQYRIKVASQIYLWYPDLLSSECLNYDLAMPLLHRLEEN